MPGISKGSSKWALPNSSEFGLGLGVDLQIALKSVDASSKLITMREIHSKWSNVPPWLCWSQLEFCRVSITWCRCMCHCRANPEVELKSSKPHWARNWGGEGVRRRNTFFPLTAPWINHLRSMCVNCYHHPNEGILNHLHRGTKTCEWSVHSQNTSALLVTCSPAPSDKVALPTPLTYLSKVLQGSLHSACYTVVLRKVWWLPFSPGFVRTGKPSPQKVSV